MIRYPELQFYPLGLSLDASIGLFFLNVLALNSFLSIVFFFVRIDLGNQGLLYCHMNIRIMS